MPFQRLMSTSVNITPGQTIVIGGTQVRTQSNYGRPFGERTLILTVHAETEMIAEDP